MRTNSTKQHQRNARVLLLLAPAFLLFHTVVNAQTPSMNDFVLFGKNSTQIGTSTSISNGRIGSYQLVQTIGNTTINATINSGDRVQLANSNTIKGNITAAGTSGTVISAGSNFSFPLNNAEIHSGGAVTIQSGSIKGTLYTPTLQTPYSGPSVTRKFPAVFPTLPALPAVANFPDPGTNNVTTTRTLQPNTSYGDLVLDGNKTVTFSGPGIYTLKKIKINGVSNKFILDFRNNTTDYIVLQVHGDVDLDKLNVQLVNRGQASRVFMEVHGNGASSPNGTEAWRIANGSSGTSQGIWYGSVWAPNGGIFVGQGSTPSKIEGSLWSGTTVSLASGVSVTYVQPAPCSAPTANAGPDQQIVCPAKQVTIGTAGNTGLSYLWSTIVNGVETTVGSQPAITVSSAGTYTLTVKNFCGATATTSVKVSYVSCIEPINPNTGKVNNLIGHELTYLTTDLEEARKHLFIIGNDSVLIEAVAVVNKETEARQFLVGLGLTNIIPNGLAYQIISGKFPIKNLNTINSRPDLINHCRPVFQPVGNAGIVTSEGDRAIAANLARGGFNIDGTGLKVGVISDSYNKSEPGIDKARQDVLNGDLPGVGNPEGHTTPVQIVGEYLYKGTDEGRAMMQLVHDLAPGAALAFRTGFNSAGDFAVGINELRDAGCQVIVDDVTYITEPFFQDGVVARTVNAVNQAGVAYFTSAGNFGQKSYTSTFRRAPAPDNIANYAHDFSGSGDIYQHLKLKSGTYTIMLQWKDNFYSLAQTTGTINDLDIYLVDQSGRIGFNRNNLGGDPFEVLSFSINLPDTSQIVDADLLITKADNSPDNPLVKYIIFRGPAVIDEYYANQPLVNKSTIVGQANAEGSIAVGAVLFSNTQPYGNTPSIASFSSSGGTPVYVNGTEQIRRKPDLTAPNGVNTSTTVVMGPDKDFVTDPINGTADGFPNFYGTSASAPHAAAAAALVLQARKKFYNQNLNTTDLRFYLFSTAQEMQPDGVVNNWNFKAGYGLVQPYAAVREFANPTPRINQLVYDANITPGTAPFTLTVSGDFLTETSSIYFRGQPIPTTYVDEHTVQATIPQFNTGNPPINVFTPSFPGATGDGGLSNSLFFFTGVKLKVAVKANNQTKKYGEVLPANSSTIFVEGDSLQVYNQKHNTNLTRSGLGLDESKLLYRYTDATVSSLSDVGPYRINVTRTFDPSNSTDVGLLEVYTYDSLPGSLQITKLPVTISPQDVTVQYGDPIADVQFNYVFDPTANLANVAAVTSAIKAAHDAHIDNSVLGVLNGTEGGAVIFFQNKILPVYSNAAIIYQNKLYPVLSGTDGSATVVIQGVEYPVVTSLSTGRATVVLQGVEYPVINGGGSVVIIEGEILPVVSKADGSAVVVLKGVEYPVVTSLSTGRATVVLQGVEYPVINGGGGAVVVYQGQYLPVIVNNGRATVVLQGVEYPVVTSLSTGRATVVLQGVEYPVQNSVRTATTVLNGKYYEVVPNATGRATVILQGVVQESGAPYINGVGGRATVVLQGVEYPVQNSLSTGRATVVLQGVEYPVVTSLSTGRATVVLQGVEYPVVNSISPTTLNNMSMSATLNAIANARYINSQPNKFVDVSANSLLQYKTGTATTVLNAYASVNARAMVDANKLANNETVQVFNTAKTTATTVLNGSGAYVNSTTLGNPAVKTPVIIDQADLNSAVGGIATISMEGINMLTGITSGEQYIIPATLFSPNFDISYQVGKATILKAPLTIKANNLSKEVSETLTINPAGFTITSGKTKYNEQVSVADMTSPGSAANASLGDYPVSITNAIGSYGTDMNNYNTSYTNGILSVVSNCPVITHSRNNGFVNTAKSPVSLWMNISIKVRGQLVKAGDSLVFRGGRLVLENINYENSSVPINVPRGVVVATPGINSPVSVYDATRAVFVTKVPVGFSSTADIFLTGAIINSRTGFTGQKNAGSTLSGIFQSNVIYNGQWNYAMAAYSALSGPTYVQYSQLTTEGDVVAMSSGYKAGTPVPWLSRITIGGSGNGGSNYTGSPTNNDNFTACVYPAVGNTPAFTTFLPDGEKNDQSFLASETALAVQPNPARTYVTVSFTPASNSNTSLQVYSANGVKLKEVHLGLTEVQKVYTERIDLQKWAKGLYIIRLVTSKGTLSRKLVISP